MHGASTLARHGQDLLKRNRELRTTSYQHLPAIPACRIGGQFGHIAMGNLQLRCLECGGCNEFQENCGNPDCQIAPKKRSSDLVLGKTCAAMKVLRDPELYLSEENDDDTFDILMHLQGNWYCESDGQLVGSVSGSLITWIRPWVPTSGIVGSRMPNESEAHVALEMEGHVLIGQVCLETQKSIVWNNGQVWLQK